MIYVYELPEKMSDGWCFGGGNSISFLNVDWLNGSEDLPSTLLPKGGPEKFMDEMVNFIKNKEYVKRGKIYLIIDTGSLLSRMFKAE